VGFPPHDGFQPPTRSARAAPCCLARPGDDSDTHRVRVRRRQGDTPVEAGGRDCTAGAQSRSSDAAPIRGRTEVRQCRSACPSAPRNDGLTGTSGPHRRRGQNGRRVRGRVGRSNSHEAIASRTREGAMARSRRIRSVICRTGRRGISARPKGQPEMCSPLFRYTLSS